MNERKKKNRLVSRNKISSNLAKEKKNYSSWVKYKSIIETN